MQAPNVSNVEPILLIEAIIIQYAIQYGIDPNLIRSIIAVESGGQNYCMRFEPKLKDKVGFHNPQDFVAGDNSLDTEMILQHSSIGAMQVLGVVARELGFKGKLLELCDPRVGIKYGCMKLKKIMERPSHSADEAMQISAYNMGTAKVNPKTGMFYNQRYVDDVYRHLRELRKLK